MVSMNSRNDYTEEKNSLNVHMATWLLFVGRLAFYIWTNVSQLNVTWASVSNKISLMTSLSVLTGHERCSAAQPDVAHNICRMPYFYLPPVARVQSRDVREPIFSWSVNQWVVTMNNQIFAACRLSQGLHTVDNASKNNFITNKL